jgi:hypothetical protein
MVSRGWTHAPGVLLAGDPLVVPLLEQPKTIPCGVRALCRAYASLLRTFGNDPDPRDMQKAVMLGFQSWFLNRTRKMDNRRNEDLFSLRGNLGSLRQGADGLQGSWGEMCRAAILTRLGNRYPSERFGPQDVLAFLNWVQGTIRISPLRWASLLYPVFQVRRGRRFIAPHRFLSTYLTLARSLSEVCSGNETASIPNEIMQGIEHLAGAACPSRARAAQKAWALNEMIALADANPHKIVIPRRQHAFTGARDLR